VRHKGDKQKDIARKRYREKILFRVGFRVFEDTK
jgi:hypothetical protein